MNSILGNYLSFGDLIVVHICGNVKDLTIKKDQEFLGLTITDNANGRAFIKRVKSDDKQVENNIKPGDHVAAINSESTVGLRHYEVAKAIRMLPQNTSFTIQIVEPKYSDKYLDSTEIKRGGSGPLSCYHENDSRSTNTNHHRHELSGAVSLSSACDDLINSSLPIDKLLSKGVTEHTNEQVADIDHQESYKRTIDKINSLLDSFLGINDNLLAIRIYRLARENKESYDKFLAAIKVSELSVFNFDDEMKSFLWKCAMTPAVE